MPATMTKITSGKNKGKYRVRTPNQTHARATTEEKAMSQRRLLNAVEHGFKPTEKPRKRARVRK